MPCCVQIINLDINLCLGGVRMLLQSELHVMSLFAVSSNPEQFRWLERELGRGNRWMRAQRTEETAQLQVGQTVS